MEISPDWLQYGALGLLTLVLAGVAWYMHSQTVEQGKMTKFIQDLVTDFNKDRKENAEQWKAMVTEHIQASTAATSTLEKLCGKMDGHEERAAERHGEIVRALERMG